MLDKIKVVSIGKFNYCLRIFSLLSFQVGEVEYESPSYQSEKFIPLRILLRVSRDSANHAQFSLREFESPMLLLSNDDVRLDNTALSSREDAVNEALVLVRGSLEGDLVEMGKTGMLGDL